jgi:hypothetical protein
MIAIDKMAISAFAITDVLFSDSFEANYLSSSRLSNYSFLDFRLSNTPKRRGILSYYSLLNSISILFLISSRIT